MCQTARWRVDVVGNDKIEYTLPFNIRELMLSSRACSFCFLIKGGAQAIRRDAASLHRESHCSLIGKRGRIIVQKSAPLEIELIRDKHGVGEEVLSRLQFFVADKDDEVGGICLRPIISDSGNFGVLGIARNLPTLISTKTHITLINSWISNCRKNHSSCDIATTSQLPSRLLDISGSEDDIYLVETRDLPSSANRPSYATLSHCWGSNRIIQTTSSTIKSFYSGIRKADLPATFQDAISVVRALGLRFIWIDSLCIVQDSLDDWKHESILMASIYSNCYVNIAATGAADSSKGCLAPRNPLYRSIPLFTKGLLKPESEDKSIFVRHSLNRHHQFYSTPTILRNETTSSWGKEKQEAPLLSRAWIFQERYLAPRTLHFCSSELVMECRKELRCECTGLDSIASNPLRDVQDISYDSWLRAVEEFSRLRLSHETDRLSALLGIAKVFHARLMSTYLRGLWAEDLARGLLWDVTRYETVHTSASPLNLPPKRQNREVAPTWSWASMVMTEGIGIIFPAAHDASFSKNPQFYPAKPASLRTMSLGTSSFDTFLETKIICVNAKYIFATVFLSEKEENTMLLFDAGIEDMILISIYEMNLDIPLHPGGLSQEQSWKVCCLILGSMTERNYELNEEAEFLCTLVVRFNSIVDAWERIGVLDVRKDDANHSSIGERVFNLM
ncbi:putative heterokaryon incompatibility protein [Botrytis fragariae]|uniref:Putative heterokaryon incompatibility protein n=1 Tax=Botrytis fragariae TaxID=1964551 RepID=A0A8H6AK70_9HELO|nr:putative heterokaryon incompatibility protein [Botrytis fragariae]KAF5869228.1 putative heterokaryon incompatibility protein [Botrytis fragariae]